MALGVRFFPFREVNPIPAALLTWVVMLFLLQEVTNPFQLKAALRDKNLCIIRVHATGPNSEKTPIDTARIMHDPDRKAFVGYDLK